MSHDDLTDDELEDQIGDIAVVIGRLAGLLGELRREQGRLKHEKARRGLSERPVSDHAIIRYLERCKGVEVEAARRELRRMADEATPAQDGEHHWHEDTGTILIIGNEGQVVTVLSADQIDKWRGRKLSNGERVPNKADDSA